MPAAYDTYDYPSYWKGREYEHKSEVLAISRLLQKIPEINKVLEVGAGFGRLLTSYKFRAKKVILTDPSAKLISKAMKKYKKIKGIEFLQSTLKNLEDKKGISNLDLILMVRVLHHIEDIDEAFKIINKLLKDKGYFILEFPNKNNLKASIRHILKGDITYPISIFPVDIRSKYNKRKGTLPFINYNPDQILEKLKQNDFEVMEIRSVSNIRSTFIKRFIPLHTLIDIEKLLQLPFAKIYFGPSFFVLARKRG